MHERIGDSFRRSLVGALAVCLVLVLGYALYTLRWVALIFAIAGLISYVFAWPVNWMAKKLPRTLAVWLAVVAGVTLTAGFFGMVIPMVYGQFVELVQQVPDILAGVEQHARGWQFSVIPGYEVDLYGYLQDFGQNLQDRTPDLVKGVFGYTQSVISGTAAAVAGVLIVPLIILYLLLDSNRLRRALVLLVPERHRPDAERALSAVNLSLGRYIGGRTVLALFVGLGNGAVLALLGVPYAVLLGLIAFAGEFIPVVGPWLAFVPSFLVVLAVAPEKLFIIAILFVAIQVVENYFIAPKLLGDTMDLHPLTVLAAMMIGGALGGIAGLFVAIPVAAALKVILNVFVLRHEEHGIEVPQLDTISLLGDPDFQENNGE